MKVAIVGATGAVGLEILKVFEQRNFKISELKLFASERSEGKSITFNNKKYSVQTLKTKCFDGTELCFFAESHRRGRTKNVFR